MLAGVSCVICCHNSAQRLPQTLAHLTDQKTREGLQWEVLVVDNASTDETSQVALTSWPLNAKVPLRVVSEPKIGLGNARHRGFTEAKYEAVSFIDDDNWVCDEWVQTISDLMSKYPNIGACGGLNEAVAEVNLPSWFAHFHRSYAVGAQGDESGDITMTKGVLFGAGLTIRKSAWQQLVSNGFCSRLVGRQGAQLMASEDYELCLALRLAGWRLWYEPKLRLRHFLPAHRLEWRYLRRLLRGVGASSVELDPYYFAVNQAPKSLQEKPNRTWQWQIYTELKSLFRQYGKKLPLSFYYSLEGDPDALRIERAIGRLFQLLRKRKLYDQSLLEVQAAPWRQVS